MLKPLSPEEFLKLYKTLPEDLKEALFNEETGETTYDVCQKNEILDKLPQVVECVGRILLGLSPVEEFQGLLEKEAEIEKETAKKAAREIFRVVFYPVRSSLETIYKVRIAPPVKKPAIPELPPLKKPGAEEAIPPEKERPKSRKPDVYREPIEPTE